MRANLLCLGVLLLAGPVLTAQEAKRTSAKLFVDNRVEEADTEPPVIKILSPVMDREGGLVTEDGQLEIIGEVSDRGKVRFLTVNQSLTDYNNEGVFVTNVQLDPGMNEIVIASMDDDYNRGELSLQVEYKPLVITLADRIKSEATYYGLLIGVEDYEDDGLDDLKDPIKDVMNLYHALNDNYTFEEENLIVLKNPTRAEIISELDLLRELVKPSDNLLVFYAGHGIYQEETETGYWLPSDASLGSTANWFPNSTLVNLLRGIESKHTLVITDACFAGSIFATRSVKIPEEIVYERIYDRTSRKAMTSGNDTEVPDKSVFLKYLIKRLEENDKQYMSSEELFGNLRNAVISNSDVLPRYGEIQNVGNEGGDFVFLKKD